MSATAKRKKHREVLLILTPARPGPAAGAGADAGVTPAQAPDDGLAGGPAREAAVAAEVRRLLGKARPRLADYHAAGALLARLGEGRTGAAWKDEAARQVDRSPAAVDKYLRLGGEPYTPSELDELDDLGVGFSRLSDSLAIRDKGQRHELLRRAKAEGWTDEGVKAELQRRKGSRRGGGRRRKAKAGHGLAADLGGLARLAGRWRDFIDQVWSAGLAGYAAEAEGVSPAGVGPLGTQLESAQALLQGMLASCGEALAEVAALREAVGRRGRQG